MKRARRAERATRGAAQPRTALLAAAVALASASALPGLSALPALPAAHAMPPATTTMAPTAHPLGAPLCAVMAARVDAVPGRGPLLLRSWDAAAGQGPPAEPALSTAAFAYDNALAAIALLACGRRPQALRIAEALLVASHADRTGEPGRTRNAWRAGPVAERPVPPMGWWDASGGRWAEDPHQVWIATGNAAWVALALLAAADDAASGRDAASARDAARWREGAARVARWTLRMREAGAPGGFVGGLHGWDDAPARIGWKSTEHNVDLAAVFARLARADDAGRPGGADNAGGAGGAAWRAHAAHARAFVDAMWDAAGGRFWIGTLPDGTTPNRARSGLDAQLWPLLLPDPRPQWRRALGFVERAHAVDGGFDFDDDRDGAWIEGTAQAALVYRVVGRDADARRLLDALAGDRSPGGYLWATRAPSITTGLALGPDSTIDDFRYHRRPHLGATAWATLAALGRNPFGAAVPPGGDGGRPRAIR